MAERAERPPRPGQGTPIAEMQFTLRNDLGAYFTALKAGITGEKLARRKQTVIDGAESLLELARAL